MSRNQDSFPRMWYVGFPILKLGGGGRNRCPAKLSGLSEVTEMTLPKLPVYGPWVRWRASPELHDVSLALEGQSGQSEFRPG